MAVLNTTLVDAADNVELRFKASPMGRWSHGHEPHNSFTLDAYGVALLVNNVYRDLYGTPFHKDWVWTSRAQNALLVDGFGQKPHSADLGGRIVKWDFQDGLEYLVGDAAAAYEGRLKKALRHVVFVKPDLIVLADEVEAPKPSTYQLMLHGQGPFVVKRSRPAPDPRQGRGGRRRRLRLRAAAQDAPVGGLRAAARPLVSRLDQEPGHPDAMARGSGDRRPGRRLVHAHRAPALSSGARSLRPRSGSSAPPAG